MDTPETYKVVAEEIPRVLTPVTLILRELISSTVRSSFTYKSASIYTSFPNVPTPTNVDAPPTETSPVMLVDPTTNKE